MIDLGNTISELKEKAPSIIYERIKKIVDDCNKNDPDSTGNDFQSDFGGGIMLVECNEDLRRVYTPIESKWTKEAQDPSCGGWASLLETASSFDSCEWIGEEEFVEVLLCTNNAGGTVFFIPADIAKAAPNVLESIRLTNVAWNPTVFAKDDDLECIEVDANTLTDIMRRI